MNAMCTMSTCSSHILDLVAADTQTVVVEYARKYADDATILQIAMATLSNLALHKRTAAKLAKGRRRAVTCFCVLSLDISWYNRTCARDDPEAIKELLISRVCRHLFG